MAGVHSLRRLLALPPVLLAAADSGRPLPARELPAALSASGRELSGRAEGTGLGGSAAVITLGVVCCTAQASRVPG